MALLRRVSRCRDSLIRAAAALVVVACGDESLLTASGDPLAISAEAAANAMTIAGLKGVTSDSLTTAPVATITVSPAAAAIVVENTVQLSATLRDSAGQVLSGRSIAWSSNHPSVALVSAGGRVIGVLAGVATITARSEGRRVKSTITVGALPAQRVGHYVAPNGTSSGTGSFGSPWSLPTALSGAGGRVRPGDTVWVRGGTYNGAFTSTVAGSPGNPVVIRAYPGERAVIDHSGSNLTTVNVRGAWTVFWGLEVTNSNPERWSASTESEQRPNAIVNDASNTKYVNLIVHDAGVAFFSYGRRDNVEVYGSLFYNNGWQAPDRGHGHALYVRSDVGPVLLQDNVMFNQFGYGVHAFTTPGDGGLNNIRVEGNTSFNNGTLANNSSSENILVGGRDHSNGSAIVDNIAYFSAGVGSRNLRVGFGSQVNGSIVVQRNRVIGGSTVLDMGYWTQASVSGNSLVGDSAIVRLNNASTSGMSWSSNEHWRDPSSLSWWSHGVDQTFGRWRSATGLGFSDQASVGRPGGVHIFVRRNLYETGRATITVYDGTGSGGVSVSAADGLNGVLEPGDHFEVRSVQALDGPPVVSGVFNGVIVLPMTTILPPAPIGFATSRAPRTGPEFDVFILTSVPRLP